MGVLNAQYLAYVPCERSLMASVNVFERQRVYYLHLTLCILNHSLITQRELLSPANFDIYMRHNITTLIRRL